MTKQPIYNFTVPLPFESYPEGMYTTPLIGELHDSYLYFIDNHPLTETHAEPTFSTFYFSP